jgi:hypothetical protein
VLPHPEEFEHYAIMTWRFEKDNWWGDVVLAEKRGE